MSAAEATCYADRAWHGVTEIRAQRQLARDTWLVRFECPQLAARIVPGQFLMLRLADFDDPLLGRPLALYDTVLDGAGRPVGVDVVYLVVGRMTGKLAASRPGQRLEVWGPLGNGFPSRPARHLLMVAGGIGQTPFMALAREALGQRFYGEPARVVPRAERITFCYGARSGEYLAGLDDFRALGLDLRTSTDDGTAGRRGLVTDLARDVLAGPTPPDRIVCCGPEKMMEAVARLAGEYRVPCEVSLETPMACGIGICFSCVARIRQGDDGWDYRRTCVEGPVFDAERVVF